MTKPVPCSPIDLGTQDDTQDDIKNLQLKGGLWRVFKTVFKRAKRALKVVFKGDLEEDLFTF